MAQSLKGPVKKITKEEIDDMLATSSDDEESPLASAAAASSQAPSLAERKAIEAFEESLKLKGKNESSPIGSSLLRRKRRAHGQREAQRIEAEIYDKQDETRSKMYSLSPEELEGIGLGNLGLAHTIIQDDYTGEGRSTKPGMSYSAPLSHTEGLPIGWHHHTSRSQHRGLSYWKGPVTYIDPNIGKYYPQTIDRTIWDYPSKQRLEEEAKYLNLSRKPYKTAKNIREIKKLQRKWQSRLSDKIDQHQRDLEGKPLPAGRYTASEILNPNPTEGYIEEGGESFFGKKGPKTHEHELQPSAIFTDSGADGTTKKIMKGELKVGGKRRKQKGGGDWLIMEDVPDEICTLCDKSLRRFSSKGETVYQLDCGHKFHCKCLSNYCKGLIADGMMGGWPCPVCGDRDEDIGDDCNTVTLYMDDPELLVPIPPVLENPNLYYRRQNGGKRTRRKRKSRKKTRRRKKTKRRRKKRTRRKRGGVLKDIALNDIKVGQRYTVTITSYRALFPTGSFRGTFEGGRQDANQQRHFHFSTTTTELPRPNAPINISIPEWEIQRVQQYNIAPHGDPYLTKKINEYVGGRRKKRTRRKRGI